MCWICLSSPPIHDSYGLRWCPWLHRLCHRQIHRHLWCCRVYSISISIMWYKLVDAWRSSGGCGGLLHLHLHINLNYAHWSSGDCGALIHIHLSCVQRQIHIYDVMGSFVFMMLYIGLWGPICQTRLYHHNCLYICEHHSEGERYWDGVKPLSSTTTP